MVFVSDFADQAVVLPLALIVALVLGVVGWWRGLFAWIAAVGATLLAMLALKFVALALSHDLAWSRAASPSGHVAAACVVYGGLAMLVLRGRMPTWLVAIVPCGVAVGMGYSRIQLLAHDPAEVMVGAAVGLIGAGSLALLAGPRPRIAAWPVVGAATGTALLFHGMHLPAEMAIRSVFMTW